MKIKSFFFLTFSVHFFFLSFFFRLIEILVDPGMYTPTNYTGSQIKKSAGWTRCSPPPPHFSFRSIPHQESEVTMVMAWALVYIYKRKENGRHSREKKHRDKRSQKTKKPGRPSSQCPAVLQCVQQQFPIRLSESVPFASLATWKMNISAFCRSFAIVAALLLASGQILDLLLNQFETWVCYYVNSIIQIRH